MKRKTPLLPGLALAVAALFTVSAHSQTPPAAGSEANHSAPIPMDQLGAVAGKQYSGDGLAVVATADGARLRCAFQRLEGEVTSEGLWLRSTAENDPGERFRVMATEVGRQPGDRSAAVCIAPAAAWAEDFTRCDWVCDHSRAPLSSVGVVNVAENVARFIRAGLTEEYTVSVDGVRQDFIVAQRPDGDGELRVELAVTGATAEPLVNGARLTLAGSGRKLVYHRLRVTDATGRELPARLEVAGVGDDVRSRPAPFVGDEVTSLELKSAIRNPQSEISLAVVVADANAIYPVRIDPTFSDADWISMGGIPGANGAVNAAVVDASGNLYIGGDFGVVGEAIAPSVAKWDGSTWSALGSGMNNSVRALAISGTDLYASGLFTYAGGSPANRIAKWNGSTWSSLGSGMNYAVYALAVEGTNVYAGGAFTTAGGTNAN